MPGFTEEYFDAPDTFVQANAADVARIRMNAAIAEAVKKLTTTEPSEVTTSDQGEL